MLLERYITTGLDLLHHFSYFLLLPCTIPLKQVNVTMDFYVIFSGSRTSCCGLLLIVVCYLWLGKAIHANLPYHLT